jgi:uncharacterized protein YfaS (alpha-2-macroglobulin family)
MAQETGKPGKSKSKRKPGVKLPGRVEKIIKPVVSDDVEKAQITVTNAEPLYREIRIDNTLTNEQGKEVRLKQGAEVDITVEADSNATIPVASDSRNEKNEGKK